MKKAVVILILILGFSKASLSQDRVGLMANTSLLRGKGIFIGGYAQQSYTIYAPTFTIGKYYEHWRTAKRFKFYSWSAQYLHGRSTVEVFRNNKLEKVPALVQQLFFQMEIGKAWTFGSYSIRDPFMPFFSIGMGAGFGFGGLGEYKKLPNGNVASVESTINVKVTPIRMGLGFESNMGKHSVINMELIGELGTHNFLQIGVRFMRRTNFQDPNFL